MGLYSIKPWFVRRLRRVEDVLVARRVSPDTLTFAAVGVSLATGAAIAAGGALNLPAVWLVVPPLVLVRLALGALDGSVARRTHTARPAGAVLNETGDRISDAAVILPAAAAVDEPMLAVGALAAGYFASFTGVLSQTATGRRDYGGPMGKADRMAVVGAGAAVAVVWSPAWTVALWTMLVGALATAAARLSRISRGLAVSAVRPEESAVIDVPTEARVEEEMLCGYGR